MNSQEVRPCVYCGKPASDRHHHPPKMAGGSKQWQGILVDLCREHHTALHNKHWFLQTDGQRIWGFRSLIGGRETLFTRRLDEYETLPVPTTALSAFYDGVKGLTDEALASQYASIQEQGRGLYFNLCAIAHAFWERYRGYGEKWAEGVARIIGDTQGINVHVREVYRQQATFAMFLAHPDYLPISAEMNKTLLATVAESDAPEDAWAYCIDAKSEEGRWPTVRQLEAHLGEKPEPEMHECPDCGATHRIKG